jgi:hypothetical protein
VPSICRVQFKVKGLLVLQCVAKIWREGCQDYALVVKKSGLEPCQGMDLMMSQSERINQNAAMRLSSQQRYEYINGLIHWH